MFDPALRGHQAIRQRLLDRVQAGGLRGSLLLAGPEGIGKRRVALELAQRELCFRKTACGTCGGCEPFRAASLPVELPNLLRIAPEGKAGVIKIGMIREDDLVEGGVIRWAHQSPAPGCHRWILVEDAHRLNGASANMLLKTLEEPPAGTHFLLVTHRPDAVIQTIRSRCERIPLKALEPVDAWAVAAGQGWEDADREAWMALSGGTLRLLDPEAFQRAKDQVEAWLALATGARFMEVAGALMPDKSSSRAQNEQVGEALERLLWVLADVARLQAGQPVRLVPWQDALGKVLRRGLDLRGAQAAVFELQRHLLRNPNAELGLRTVAAAL